MKRPKSNKKWIFLIILFGAYTAVWTQLIAFQETKTIKLPPPKYSGKTTQHFPQINYAPNITFESLNMCSKSHGMYHCQNGNINCSLGLCQRTKSKSVTFNGRKIKRFYQEAPIRFEIFQTIFQRFPKFPTKLFLMIFNIGFAHQFGNWYCSILHHLSQNEIDELKQHMLILTADANATKYVQSLGFITTTPFEMKELLKWSHKIILPQAAITFGRGSHASLNLILKLATPLDLFTMFPLIKTIIIQDVDIVWKQNAFVEMLQICFKYTCDGLFIQEGRSFAKHDFVTSTEWMRPLSLQSIPPSSSDLLLNLQSAPELNTGLFLLTKNMLPLLQTGFQGHYLQEWKGRDQPFINSLIYHSRFHFLNILALPMSTFVPGSSLHKLDKIQSPLTSSLWTMIHFSDTGSFSKKIEKAKLLHIWYFTNESCPNPLIVSLCKLIDECWKPILGYKKEEMTFQDDSDPNWKRWAKEQGY